MENKKRNIAVKNVIGGQDGSNNRIFYRLENYILCMLIARKAFNTGVISGETYDLIENEMSKEFLVKKVYIENFSKIDDYK